MNMIGFNQEDSAGPIHKGLEGKTTPRDIYESVLGKHVCISGGSISVYGVLETVDIANQMFVLSDVPIGIESDGSLLITTAYVPMSDKLLTVLPKGHYSQIKEIFNEIDYLREWVQIGQEFGVLMGIGLRTYSLKPAYVMINGSYKLINKQIYVSKPARVIPVDQSVVDELVKKNELEQRIKELDLTNRIRMLSEPKQDGSRSEKASDTSI